MTIDDLFKRIVRARLPLLACFVIVPLLGVQLLGSRQHPVWVANARVQVFDGAPSSTTEADGSSSRVLALATKHNIAAADIEHIHLTRMFRYASKEQGINYAPETVLAAL